MIFSAIELMDFYEFSCQVRLHLLTAVMKCFFKRPPETQKALGAALAAGLADFHQVSLCLILPNYTYLQEKGDFELDIYSWGSNAGCAR